GEYFQWRERFMNYLEEWTHGKAMINSIQNDRKDAILYEYETFKAIEGEQLFDTYLCYLQYGTPMRQTKNLMDINIDALYNVLKQNQGDVNDALGYKRKAVVVTSDPLTLVAEKMNVSKQKEKVFVSSDSEGSGADDFSELKNITAFLAKAFNRRKFYSKPTNNNLRTTSTSYKDQRLQLLQDKDGLFVNDNDDQEIFHDAIESASENFIENHIDSQKDNDKSEVDHNDSEEKEHLVDKLQEKILEKDMKISELEGSVSNKDVEIEKCLERLNECENKLHKIRQTNQTIHMIMPSKDTLYNGRKGIGFENPSYFKKAKDLRPSLYDEMVISLGYTPMFLIHSDEALEIEKFKRARENKIEFAYDHGNLNASYVNEKINFSDDYFQEIINLDFEKIDSQSQQTSSLKPYVLNVILEKIIIDLEDEVNPKVIAPGVFKLSVSQSVSLILMSKTSCESKNVENTFSSVRRPKHSDVIWKMKGSSNTSNVNLSSVSHLKLNKDVKRYSRKDLLSCNNPHLGETSSAYVCNDAMNVSCNSRMCDLFDENNLFIFDDESVKISPISQICLWIIYSGCLKHMTGNRALLTNFVEKFLETVRFGNNDFMVIVGYGDVVIGLMTIKKV
nr:integrase, catalytic region, zinc finger, CCHC-type, peptidase aspartic, catalytic [Tanacetum cinerariifolium]